MKRVFEDSSYELIEMQENFRKCVDQVYNLNGVKGLEEKPSNFVFFNNSFTCLFSVSILVSTLYKYKGVP